ncbi:MAG TPA: beta-N-acetylhexosaminidase [Pseudonocardiaceae bacterium]|jgi:hexosaminidase|nr:beta-N-acetylhexosaminidase [Pseudonocardiaceae bacterium]
MRLRRARGRWIRLAVLIAAVAMVGNSGPAWGTADDPTENGEQPEPTMGNIVPEPVSVQPTSAHYRITADTTIRVQAASAAVARIGEQLAAALRRSTGYPLPVISGAEPGRDTISLLLSGAEVGAEGYRLDVTGNGVVIRANEPAGLFNGVQTLRQLLPAAADSASEQPGPWLVPGGHVMDHPRFGYRGAMLDVARHFFPVADVERFIDEISLYKINYLHLHLSDDQGWRIAVAGWPNLTDYGSTTEVGGGAGGYYTQEQYQQIVAYAKAHYVTIVPEIDGPGHTNAALASYPDLNCDGVAPPLYTGIEVGFSSFCVNKDETYTFLNDVIGELARLTPGPYLHVGGDEAESTTAEDYSTFEGKVLPLVTEHGKTAMGWHELAKADPPTSVVTEYWGTTSTDAPTAAAAARGNKIVMAPANKAYLDQKYNEDTKLGLKWAAYIEVADAYNWDPATYLTGVGESSVLGVEAPLWSETLVTMANIEYLAFPRLPAIAELGWSPQSSHNWSSFQRRLGAQGPRWTAMGINFYASPQIPWAPGSIGGSD